MKNKFLHIFIVFILVLSAQNISAQGVFSSKIDSIINLCTNPTLSMLNRELTGDTSTIIGGLPYTILSRHNNSPHNLKAAQFILERFQSYGLTARYMDYRSTGRNVLAVKTGTKYPNRQYIICAHYDDMPSGPLAPGADDNASGTCAVMEAARLIAPLSLDYTVIFIAFDEEEQGLIGSHAYADSAFNKGDSILGVLNFDMISWDGNNDYAFSIYSNSNSLGFSNNTKTVFNTYVPVVVPTVIVQNMSGSDHYYFWQRGYKAFCGIENTSDFNPYYHTVNDNFSHVVMPFFLANTRGAIAALLTFAWDFSITFEHEQLPSNNDTTDRTAVVTINSPQIIVTTGANAPRLYYKVNSGPLSYSSAFYNNLDTFMFNIPGQPMGSTVSYYFAAQDSLERFVGTLPAGGRGISPPGVISPAEFFTYDIANIATSTFCSTTLPKPILDNQTTYDTIAITETGNVIDMNVNLTIYHTWDGDISIYLKGPNETEIDLSSRNGGSGNNYINTVFDDEATTSITSGTPPFTGSYRPEQPLSTFDNNPMDGNWILRVRDDFNNDTGQIISWCLVVQHSILIGTPAPELPVKYNLSQNYPNPFNASTKIKFAVAKESGVKIVLFDVLGREVRTLVNDKVTPGEYGIYLNANDLASGIYFYTMFLDGNFFATKKMIMIK